MTTIRHYLKLCAAWATGLPEKYASDLFFRTTLHIIGLQSALVLLCIAALIFSLLNPAHQWVALAGLALLEIVFGVLLAQLTLRPARDSLTYQKIFISNVAHELRTPLSTIKTSTEVALLDEKLPQKERRVMLDIVGELDRISEILNNLLSLNTLTRPERMQLRNVELSPIVEAVLERHRTFARERGINMVVRKDPYTVAWGNETALEQVFTNLIKNALSYTPKNTGGKVTVEVRPDYHGSIIFSVADTGIGISQEDLFHIFEPFYRADTSRVRNIKKSGSGLGLTIVNEIVRIHRGKIHIESGAARGHKGTTVVVTLPSGAPPKTLPPEKHDIRSQISVDFSRRRTPPAGG